MSVNIKRQNTIYIWILDVLRVSVLVTQMCGFVYYTHTEARVMLAVFSASAASIYFVHEHINNLLNCCGRHFMSILPFLLRKLSSYYIQTNLIKVQFNLTEKYYLNVMIVLLIKILLKQYLRNIYQKNYLPVYLPENCKYSISEKN